MILVVRGRRDNQALQTAGACAPLLNGKALDGQVMSFLRNRWTRMIGAPFVGGLVGVCLGYVGGYVVASLLPNIDDFGVVAFFYGSIFACVGLVFGPLLAWRFWPREVLGKAAVAADGVAARKLSKIAKPARRRPHR